MRALPVAALSFLFLMAGCSDPEGSTAAESPTLAPDGTADAVQGEAAGLAGVQSGTFSTSGTQRVNLAYNYLGSSTTQGGAFTIPLKPGWAVINATVTAAWTATTELDRRLALHSMGSEAFPEGMSPLSGTFEYNESEPGEDITVAIFTHGDPVGFARELDVQWAATVNYAIIKG